MEKKEIYELPLQQIEVDANQPRKYFDEDAIFNLSQSISKKGLLQPILVRFKNEDKDKYVIVAGERRFRAVKLIGWSTISAILTNENPTEVALIENIQREDLSPIEEAEAYENLINKNGYTQNQLADIVGKARSTIAHILTLNKLPERIKRECLGTQTSKRILLEIAKEETEEEMINRYQEYINLKLNSDDLRKKRKKRDKNSPVFDIAIKKLQEVKKILSRLTLVRISADQRQQLRKEYIELERLMNSMPN